jgi:hypothetical protein
VERDQLFERAALLGFVVVEAVHEQVGRVRERVGPEQMARGAGREGGERILALDVAVAQPVRAVRAERDGAVGLRPDQHEPHVRVGAQRSDQLRVTAVDLLQGQPLLAVHQVDEAEIAGAQHDDLAFHALGLGRRAPRRRLVQCLADGARVLVAGIHPVHVAGRQRSLHQVVQAVAVALPERRPLRLAVVRQDDDLVRPGGI